MDPIQRQVPIMPRRSFVAPPPRRPLAVAPPQPTRPAPLASAAPVVTVPSAPLPPPTPVAQQPFNDIRPPQPVQPPVSALQPQPHDDPADLDMIIEQLSQPVQPAAVAPPQIAAPQQPQITQEKKKWKFWKPAGKRSLMAVIAGGILFIGLGGTAAAYYGVVVPNRPENVLLEALGHSFDGTVKSAAFNGTIITQSFNIGFSGAYNDKGNYQTRMDINYGKTKASADFVNPDGKTVYGRFSGLPSLAADPTFKADANQAFYHNLFSAYAPLVKSTDNTWYQQSVQEFYQDDQAATNMSMAYSKHPFLKMNGVYSPELVNGDSSERYSVLVDGPQLKDFLISLRDANLKNFKVSQDQLSLINMNIDAINFNSYPMDVWIKRDTKVINQLAMTGDTTKVKVTFSDFNQPVSFSAPGDAKQLDGLKEQIRGINATNLLTSAGILNGETTGLDVIILTALQ